MADIDLPLQFNRLTENPAVSDTVFTTTAALNAYLTNPVRYAGQIVSLVEGNQTKVYKLNFDKDKWEELQGGVASPEIYKIFNAEKEDLTGFTNISINTTSPINGAADYSVTAFPAALPDVSLSPRNLNKRNTMTFEYTLASGTAKVAVSGGGLASPVEVELSSDDTRAVIEYTPASLTDLEIDITDVSSATTLNLDDIVFSDGQRPVKEFTKSDVVTYKGFTSRSGTGVLFKTQETSSRSELITVDSSSGTTRYYANSDLDFTAVYSHYGTDASIKLNLVDTGSLIRYFTEEYANAVQGRATVSMTGRLLKGEYVYATASDNPIDDDGTNFSISATATAEGTVYASETSASDIVVEGAGNGGTVLTANVTPIDFTEVEDTNNAWSGTVFTAPDSGIYAVTGSARFTAITARTLSSYINGTLKETISYNSSAAILPFATTIYLNENDELTIRTGESGTLLDSSTFHHITITKASSNYDNLIVDVGTKHVTGGEEYLTGDTLDGKPIWARTYAHSPSLGVATQVELATIEFPLNIIELKGVYKDSDGRYKPVSVGSGQFKYDDDDGKVLYYNNTASAITDGRFTILYTKP